MPELSMRKYAQLRGVSHTAVQEAIKAGRLRKAVKKKKGNKIVIDSDLADFEWEKNTDQTKRHNVKDRGQKFQAEKKPTTTTTTTEQPGRGINDLRNAHETIRVRLAKLDLDAREGKLISADAVRDEAFRLGRNVRDSLLNIPDKISGTLAGITEPNEIHRRLTDEIKKAIQGLPK